MTIHMLYCFNFTFIVLVSKLLICHSSGIVEKNSECFPKTFFFGTGTGAYQVEGAWNVSGKGVSTWDYAVHQRNFTKDNSSGDVACDSYHLYREDVKLLKGLGIKVYKFSVSWTRVLPTGMDNYINPDGIRYYNALIDELIANGIEPMLVMYHWDLPQKLEELGGWLNPYIASYFVDYAKILLDNYSDRVKYWVTFNEPMNFCAWEYRNGLMPPFLEGVGVLDYQCRHSVLISHGRVYRLFDQLYRNKTGVPGKMGMTFEGGWYEPLNDSVENIEAAERRMQFYIGSFAHPIFSKEGDYPPLMRKIVDENSKRQGFHRSRLPVFTSSEVDLIRGSADFYALQHYSTFLTSYAKSSDDPGNWHFDDEEVKWQDDPSWPQGTIPHHSIVPWGIRKALNWIKNNFNNPEIIITENGMPSTSGLHDVDRIKYMVAYLRAVLEAMNLDGCTVHGYMFWSLMDNFEWIGGYQEKYGLHAVDFTSPNRTRTPRLSAMYYSELAQTGCLPDIEKYINE